MRTKAGLFELKEITVLLQYLYLDSNHTILFNNGIVDLEVKMTENYGFQVLNHNFPELGYSSFTDMMTIPQILGIIEVLKETPSRQPDFFSTEWEEIEKITLTNVGLNAVSKSLFETRAKPAEDF